MKTSRTLTSTHQEHRPFLAGIVFILALAISSPATYAGTNWDGGGGSGNWSVADNWNANTAPSSGATLTFAGELQTITNNDYFAAGTIVNAFAFTNDGTIGKMGNFTLSGNSVTNTGTDIVTTAIAVGGTNLTDTISLNIALNNNKAFVLGAGHDLVISGTLSGSKNITKNGTGTLTLSADNTYTGSTTINAGTLSIATITNGGVAGALGNSTTGAGNLVLGGGTLQYTGSNGSTDRNFTLSNATTSVIDVFSAGTTLTISGTATATTGGLTKNGSGTLLLAGGNNYTGDTTINSGTLQLGTGNNRISDSSTLRVNGGTFNIVGFNDTVAGVVLSANGTITGTNGVLTSASEFILENGMASAILAGTVGVNKTTSGTVILSSANTYTGATTINAGTLQIGNGGTTGALSTSSAITNNGTLTFNRSNTITQGTNFASVISGTGNVTQAGTGTLSFNGTNTYTGTTTISAGTLALNSSASNNSTISGDILINGGTLNYGTTVNDQISNAATVTLSSGSFALAARDETIGSIAMSGGGISITSGWLTLSSTSSFTGGNVSITSPGGRIITASTGPTTLGNAAFVYNNTGNSSTAGLILSSDLAVNASTTANFTNASTGIGQMKLNGATRTIDVDTGAAMNVGWIISGGSGDGLTKNGTGTLTLSAANTYTGATLVSAGTLLVNGSTSASSTMSVGSGAALGGSGTINGSVSINSGATLIPGIASTLTLGSTLTLESGSTMALTLGSNSSKIAFATLADNLLGSGNATLSLTQGDGFDYGATYTIFQNTSTTGFVFSSITGYDSDNWTANFGLSSNNYQLSFTAVPEPSTYALLFAGLTGVFLFRGSPLRRRFVSQVKNHK